jgi:uncharacterized protein
MDRNETARRALGGFAGAMWQESGKDQTVVRGFFRNWLRGSMIARALAGLAVGAVVLTPALPASAQMFSEGYQFLKAVKDRDGDTATDMLNKPGTQIVNSRDLTSGDTGLHISVQRMDALWVRFLLQRGADPNIRNKRGITPLQLATQLSFIEGVEELIKGGANVQISDQTGETPLIAAVLARNVPLVRLLLDKGADPDRNDNSGRSARDYMQVMAGNTLMKQEFDNADKKRAEKGTPKDYGPSM